jgi:hypothetical protein
LSIKYLTIFISGATKVIEMRWNRRAVGLSAVLLGLLACKRSGEAFQEVPAAEVNQENRSKAERFGNAILHAWAKDEYPQIDNATEAFAAAMGNEERQRSADKLFEEKLGAFQTMALHEVLQRDKLEIYRFKGVFEKGPAEVRVTTTPEGKIAGHFIKPWKDKL